MCEYRPTVLDMFSGAGGLSKGFADAGYDVILGVDHDRAALQTWEANHEGTAMDADLYDHANLEKITDFVKKSGKTVDVIVGGPPCQGFSIAGPRDMNDRRNFLYTAMVKLCGTLKPKAVVLENVPGMLNTNGGIGAQRIVKDFGEIGYRMIPKLLYAPDYGVPQIRKRVFFVGLRDSDEDFIFPEPSVGRDCYVTCSEAIGDLPSLTDADGNIIRGEEIQEYACGPQNMYQEKMRRNSGNIRNHLGSIPNGKTKKLIALVPEGKNRSSLPPEYRNVYTYHEALTRYSSKKPSLTVNTGHRCHFHYKWDRIPTVRESARLQSFPDDFVFYGNKGEQYRQVGNAVPPLLGQAVAEQLLQYIGKEHDGND